MECVRYNFIFNYKDELINKLINDTIKCCLKLNTRYSSDITIYDNIIHHDKLRDVTIVVQKTLYDYSGMLKYLQNVLEIFNILTNNKRENILKIVEMVGEQNGKN